jgi:4-hydroxy-tetrahydrodipicolinate synthase
MNFQAQGIIPPLVTPFHPDGSVNEAALRRVINHVIDAGVHGVFVGGSQGEFFALEEAELIRVFEVAVEEVNGRVPVYAGTAAITTAKAVRLTRAAEAAGCDAVSVITPFFITPNDQELYLHYKAVAEATRLPVLLYNNPDRTGFNLSVETISRLARIENVIGMKDSSGNLTLVGEVIRNTGPDFRVFCGRDTVIFQVLASGGGGAVPASGNVAPRLIVELYDHFRRGDLEAARAAQFKLAPLRMAFNLGSFPVVIKEALNLMGLEVGSARPPIQPLVPEKREQLAGVLREIGLIE